MPAGGAVACVPSAMGPAEVAKREVGAGTARHLTGFVMHLLLKQHGLRLGYGAFAKHLGMDRSLWYLIRTGQREPSPVLVQRVLQLWPGEFEDYLAELIRHRYGLDAPQRPTAPLDDAG